ncbi:MAG: response regulator [Candidatus Caenarcaniphilales bacterium]|nr:response regulator [Candidatus Caenarcaniphilales bacterium]
MANSKLPKKTLKILVVDDDLDDLLIVQDIIRKRMKFENPVIDCVTNFEQAIEKYYTFKHDICLMDFNLGKRTGISIFNSFRESGINIPMIFLTGNGSEELATRVMKMGADNYFSKSKLNEEELIEAIRSGIRAYKYFKNVTCYVDTNTYGGFLEGDLENDKIIEHA